MHLVMPKPQMPILFKEANMSEYNNPKYQPNHESRLSHDAARLAEDFTERFREVLSNPVDVIGLSEFRRVMLPMLAEIAYGREFDLDRWFTIVSHPSVELSVVDDMSGAEIYRLSSVWQQTDISCKDEDMVGMSVFVDSINALKSTDMIAAHDRLMELADERVDHTPPEQTIRDAVLAINRLNKVFEDHQLPMLPDPNHLLDAYKRRESGEPEPTEEPVTAEAPKNEPVEYDEL